MKNIQTKEDILSCFKTFKELRPHLKDKMFFLEQILKQKEEGYEIRAILQKREAAACIGYRVLTTLAWGRILYIDDLSTRKIYRGRGYAAQLLQHAIAHAKTLNCLEVHLDTGYTRYDAHKLYLNQGFHLNGHHLSLAL